jgi:anti-anti-sigma factor
MAGPDPDDAAPAVVVPLTGELDASDPRWVTEIRDALDTGARRIVVDMLNVTFIDSSVVKELLLADRRTPPDGWIHLVYTHHLIRRVIEICGLADLFPQFTTVDAALRDAPTQHLRAQDDSPARPGVNRSGSGHTPVDAQARTDLSDDAEGFGRDDT